MKLTDIQSLDKWVLLEKEITEKSGLDANIFDTKGIRISDYKEWANRLCPAIKATDKGQSFICAVAHMNIAVIAENTNKPAIEECDAGLMKLVVPIFYKGEFIGAAGACGMALDDGEADSFLINKITDISEEKIENLSGDISKITTLEAESLSEFIQNRLNEIILIRRNNT